VADEKIRWFQPRGRDEPVEVRNDVGQRPGVLRRRVAFAEPGTVVCAYDRPLREVLLDRSELILVCADAPSSTTAGASFWVPRQ
jgi:hypothetical protein